MRLGVADAPRFGRPVDAVVVHVDVDPDNADGIVGAGLQRCLSVAWLCVPEEIRVVFEGWPPADAVDLPVAGRQRIFSLPVVTGAKNTSVPSARVTRSADSPFETVTVKSPAAGSVAGLGAAESKGWTAGTSIVVPASKRAPGFSCCSRAGEV